MVFRYPDLPYILAPTLTFVEAFQGVFFFQKDQSLTTFQLKRKFFLGDGT